MRHEDVYCECGEKAYSIFTGRCREGFVCLKCRKWVIKPRRADGYLDQYDRKREDKEEMLQSYDPFYLDFGLSA